MNVFYRFQLGWLPLIVFATLAITVETRADLVSGPVTALTQPRIVAQGQAPAESIVIRAGEPTEMIALSLESPSGGLTPVGVVWSTAAPFTYFLSNSSTNVSWGAALGSLATIDGDFVTGAGYDPAAGDLKVFYTDNEINAVDVEMVSVPLIEEELTAIVSNGTLSLLALDSVELRGIDIISTSGQLVPGTASTASFDQTIANTPHNISLGTEAGEPLTLAAGQIYSVEYGLSFEDSASDLLFTYSNADAAQLVVPVVGSSPAAVPEPGAALMLSMICVFASVRQRVLRFFRLSPSLCPQG